MKTITWQHTHRHEWGLLSDQRGGPTVADGGEQVEEVQGEAGSHRGHPSSCTIHFYEGASPTRPCLSTWPTAESVH